MLLQITDPLEEAATFKKKSPDIVVGIDLGTTNSLVAGVLSTRARVIPDNEGRPLLPSVVDIKTNTLGHQAFFQKDAKRSFKSSMGASDPDNAKEAVLLSSMILKTLKDQAEVFFEAPVTKAVVTVPAYFDEAARLATIQAASLAGLEVMRLINEPTAAALAYGLERALEGLYLIYDLGGGTFDASLLRLSKGVFQVIATTGNRRLGGDDVDLALARYLTTLFKDTAIEPDDLILDARQIKEYLTNHHVGVFDLLNEEFALEETLLEDVAGSLIEKTIELCRSLLLDANVSVEDIKGVVLVGGSTRLKVVRRMVAHFFKKEPYLDIDPEQVVALGAATQAHMLAGGAGSHLLLDVTPLSLGLETMGGVVEKIIPKNTSIPCSVAQEFTTYEDGQISMVIHVVQGERELAENCLSLGRFILSNIPALPAGGARIQVTFQLDADGLLTVHAVEKSTNHKQSIELKPSYGLSLEDFQQLLQESILNSKDDLLKRFWINETVKSSHLVNALSKALEEDSDLLNEEEKAVLFEKIMAIKVLLKKEDVSKTQELSTLRKDLNQESLGFAQRRTTQAFKKALEGSVLKKNPPE